MCVCVCVCGCVCVCVRACVWVSVDAAAETFEEGDLVIISEVCVCA